MFAYRTKEKLNIEFIPTTVYCMRILHPLFVHSDIDEALRLSFKYDGQDSQEEILEYLDPNMSKDGKDELILNCAVCTSMYDQPIVLQNVLQL